MKWNLKRDVFALSLLIIFLLISWYFYGILPDTIPSHFDMNGLPDDYSAKSTVIILGIGISVILYFALTFLPMIDPFWKMIEKKYNLFLLFRDLVMGFVIFEFILTLISAKDGLFRDDLFGIGFGLLFVLLGNYMPKLPRNFFFGIRSPWTLASEEVWNKTHRIGGTFFVAGGILIIILTLFGLKLLITMIVVIVPLSIYTAVIYPLMLYKKLQKEGKLKNPDL